MRGKNSAKVSTAASARVAKVIYQCTACKTKIRTTFEANLHPLIGTLVCRNCKDTYGNGDFAKNWEDGVDELGDDNYCRWCCDGGNLFGCMNVFNEGITEERCHYAFCSDCIAHNMPNDFILKSAVESSKIENENYEKLEKKLSDTSNGNSKENSDRESEEKLEDSPEEKWLCYACDKTKLAHLRENALAAIKELSERERKRTATNQGLQASQKKKRKTENGPPSPKAASLTSKESAAPKEPTTSKELSASKEPNLADIIFSPPGLIPKARLQEDNIVIKQDSEKLTNSSITKNSQTTKDAQGIKKQLQEQPSLTKDPQKTRLAQTKDAIKETDSTPEVIPTKKISTQAPTTEQVTSSDKALPTKEGPLKTQTFTNSSSYIRLSSAKDPVVIAKQSTLAAAKAVAASLIAPVRPRPMSNSYTIVSNNQTTTNQKNVTTNSSRVVDSQPRNNRDLKLTERQKSNHQVKNPEIVQQISEVEMKRRLQAYSTIKDTCIEEVNTRFTNLVQMLNSNDTKSKKVTGILVDEEIGGLQKAMKEFEVMLRDIKKLSQSSSR